MSVIKRTEKENGVVECLIDSSNILLSEYNKTKKTLKITFKSGDTISIQRCYRKRLC